MGRLQAVLYQNLLLLATGENGMSVHISELRKLPQADSDGIHGFLARCQYWRSGSYEGQIPKSREKDDERCDWNNVLCRWCTYISLYDINGAVDRCEIYDFCSLLFDNCTYEYLGKISNSSVLEVFHHSLLDAKVLIQEALSCTS